MLRPLTVAVLSLTAIFPVIPAQSAEPVLGRSLGSFALKDYRGRDWSEQDFAQHPVLVVVVIGIECPLAKMYSHRLQVLADELAGENVGVVALDPNRQDSITEIAAFAKEHELKYPILKDLNNVVADRLGAERTPTVYVLDRDRQVRYHGRIDDQHAVGAKSRPEPSRHDLKEAVRDLLANRNVRVAETEPVGCLIGRVRTPKTNSEITYTKHIAKILNDRCVECHRDGEIAPFSLTDYAEVAGWADMIREVTRERRMPPWHADPKFGHFSNENRLSAEELAQIDAWVLAGAPEGNPADLPQPPTFTAGWQLPREPDYVAYMSPKPFNVKAEGEVRYQYFLVETDFTEDKWVTAAEIIPGNRAVVHHVIVFATPDKEIADDDRQMLIAYVPGMRTELLPKGMAKRVPAKSKLIFQVHYTPNGTAQEDRTKVGLLFTDEQDVKYEVQTASARTRNFKIQPMQRDQQFSANPITAPRDVLLLSLSPHMHLRGQSFRYDLTWPDGRTETLLDVPQYDFNWQTGYRLAEPMTIPKGSRLVATAKYDNTADNPANPDPTQTVIWGDQSWEEMMIGYFDVAVERGTAAGRVIGADLAALGTGRNAAKQLMTRLDKNGDGKLEKSEAGDRMQAVFDRVDTDKDGSVSLDELERGLATLRR
ncbi:MAG: redoxin domain-containing protein, partial [Planctomycetaceae bacterium]|nr:redoxin domain-containing protein [Planctomycetaceae bacterium]